MILLNLRPVFKNHNRFRPSHKTAVTSVAPPRRTSSKRPLKGPNNPARRYGLARPYGDYYQASSASSSLNKSGYYYDGDYKTLALIVLVPLALYLALVFLLSFATALNTLQTYLATHNFTFPNVTFGFANGLFPGYGGNRGVVVIPQQQQQQQSSSNNNNNNDNNAAIYFNGGLYNEIVIKNIRIAILC